MSAISNKIKIDKDSALIGALLSDDSVNTITIYGETKPDRVLPILREKYSSTRNVQNLLDYGPMLYFESSLTKCTPAFGYDYLWINLKSAINSARKNNIGHIYLFDLKNKAWKHLSRTNDYKEETTEGIIRILPIIEAITTDDELDEAIKEYKKLEDEIAKKHLELKEELGRLNEKEKLANNHIKEIKKYMIRFDIKSRKVEKWVALITEQLKYKTVRPDYKELWLTLLTKVNEATRNVMKAEEELQKKTKAAEKETVLKIEGIGSWFDKLYKNFKKYFTAVDEYSDIVDNLIKI